MNFVDLIIKHNLSVVCSRDDRWFVGKFNGIIDETGELEGNIHEHIWANDLPGALNLWLELNGEVQSLNIKPTHQKARVEQRFGLVHGGVSHSKEDAHEQAQREADRYGEAFVIYFSEASKRWCWCSEEVHDTFDGKFYRTDVEIIAPRDVTDESPDFRWVGG